MKQAVSIPLDARNTLEMVHFLRRAADYLEKQLPLLAPILAVDFHTMDKNGLLPVVPTLAISFDLQYQLKDGGRP